MISRRLHQFEWLESKNLLNGNSLVDLPQFPTNGPVDLETVCVAQGSPGAAMGHTPGSNAAGESEPQDDPISNNEFSRALQEYLKEHHEQQDCTDANCLNGQEHDGVHLKTKVGPVVPPAGSVRQFSEAEDEQDPSAIQSSVYLARDLGSLEVTIEVRFLQVKDDFFERIGVDFDFDIDDRTPGNTVRIPDQGSVLIGGVVGSGGVGVPALGQLPYINRLFKSDDKYADTPVQLPMFSFETVSTNVSVPDGGTLVLGGIKRLSEGSEEFGVPVLSEIPYVNRLFRNVGSGHEAGSLVIMVTPRIIIQEE